MTLTAKLPLFAAGATATVGVGALAVKELAFSKSQESIASLLSQDLSKRAISKDEDWSKVWSLYKSSAKDIWGLKNSGADVPESFKDACKNKLESKVGSKDSKEYQDFLTYCTRDTLMSDLIKENAPNKELLVKKTGSDADWVKSWKSYVESEKNKKQAGGDHTWGLSDWNNNYSKLDTAPDSFMDKCVANVKEPFHDIKGTLYLDTLRFCTKDKATNG
ncbi:hypothetical protein MHC_04535 [Mycoplasma haemocanis str. Illinois]|uniref:Uncharacterized protein n=1 Tax=Mycoplasma haemocanis (strain Illinois) TaxID=1111676 RepID=H6N7Z1_MYCHN|nr:hypothetical protein [Mycoplasma haemocanis]AEW45763.1 hypothetical protein MHC_04535 [Mycoplasma haemocanis str. Illinois]